MEKETEIIENENKSKKYEIKKLDDEIVLNMVARALYNQLKQDLESGEFMIDENNEIVPGPNFNATKREK